MKDKTDKIALMADNRFTTKVAFSPLQPYSSSAIGVNKLHGNMYSKWSIRVIYNN